MRSIHILLPDAKTIQEFVDTLETLNGDFDLVSGEYILDARSLMGIFSFDNSKPIELRIYDDSKETLDALEAFTVKSGREGSSI